jgi:short-subunit dehydrogenase
MHHLTTIAAGASPLKYDDHHIFLLCLHVQPTQPPRNHPQTNNAGIAATGGFLAEDSLASAQRHFDTNVFGPMRLTQAFAPVLAANGGGAILNVLSIASWINGPLLGVYGMSKSAAWAMTNGTRMELSAQNTQVLALHVGFVDTDLTRGLDVPKSAPEGVVRTALDALEAGASEVLADEVTRQVHAGLSAQPAVYLQSMGL